MNEPAFETTVIASAEPVIAAERNDAIDMLRGIAVLGILVMNIYAFAMPFVAYSNPLAYGGIEPWNLATWFFTHLFFDQKFMTIFSLLFGAGLIMMMNRAETRGVKYAGVWYRRNFWLLLIGAMHGYLIWMGDILFHYALVGMIVYLFRKLSPRALIVIAVFFLMIAPFLSFSGGIYMDKLRGAATEIEVLKDEGKKLTEEQAAQLEKWEEMSVFLGDPGIQVEKDLKGYSGNYPEIVKYRQPTVTMMQTQATVFFIIWRVGGVMLLGMALMKLGIISGARGAPFYRKMLLIGYGIGLPVVGFSGLNLWDHGWEPMWAFRVGMLPNYVGSILVAFGHIGLVMTIIKSGVASKLMARFGAVGRMAFSNYLMHSVILTTIFYGYGFGLYGKVPRIWQMVFVVAVLAFQLWLSPIWLKLYRFGPAEWLWRSLTYWKRQPMRRASNIG